MGMLDGRFDVVVPGGDEGDIRSPADLLEAARKKVCAVRDGEPTALIVGADTGVFLGDRHLGKPADLTEAKAYLRALAGRWHAVFTGVHAALPGDAREALVETRVRFRELTDEELEWYVASEEVLDKAGGYGVQGRAAVFVECIQGEYANVVGLPLATLYRLLRELGWRPDMDQRASSDGGEGACCTNWV